MNNYAKHLHRSGLGARWWETLTYDCGMEVFASFTKSRNRYSPLNTGAVNEVNVYLLQLRCTINSKTSDAINRQITRGQVMSIFGKVILDELTRNSPEKLMYVHHNKTCTWYKRCTCALDQYMGKEPDPKVTQHTPAVTAKPHLIVVLASALWWSAFVYGLAR